METWPAQFQALLNTDAFSYGFGNTNVRSDMDVGLAKVRKRYTSPVDFVTATITIDYDDWVTLRDFYRVTLRGGVETFSFNHPLTGVAAEWRFSEDPTVEPLGGRVFRVSMKWDLIP